MRVSGFGDGPLREEGEVLGPREAPEVDEPPRSWEARLSRVGGFRVKGLGFPVSGSGLRVQGSGFAG